MGVESLLLKAEALYFIEVEASLKRDDIVSGYPRDGPICGVPSCVEGQGSFPGNDLDLLLVWLKLPQQSRTSVGVESTTTQQRWGRGRESISEWL